jgi:hypothetical protein
MRIRPFEFLANGVMSAHAFAFYQSLPAPEGCRGSRARLLPSMALKNYREACQRIWGDAPQMPSQGSRRALHACPAVSLLLERHDREWQAPAQHELWALGSGRLGTDAAPEQLCGYPPGARAQRVLSSANECNYLLLSSIESRRSLVTHT